MKIASIVAACLLATFAAAGSITVKNLTPSDIWVRIPVQLDQPQGEDSFYKIASGSSASWIRSLSTVAFIDYNEPRDVRTIRVDPGNTYNIGGELPKLLS
ncbi:hypothetical protein FBU30_010214 [Linnemannia zychae]|nr:hypothetical protein FBU30_010214 [Linnemannia zychae]